MTKRSVVKSPPTAAKKKGRARSRSVATNQRQNSMLKGKPAPQLRLNSSAVLAARSETARLTARLAAAEAMIAVLLRNAPEDVREDAEDEAAVAAELANPSPAIPEEVVKAKIKGDSPVKAWRSYKKLTQAELAGAVGTNTQYISQIERGQRQPGDKLLGSLSAVLEAPTESLIA